MQVFEVEKLFQKLRELEVMTQRSQARQGWVDDGARPHLQKGLLEIADLCAKAGLNVSEKGARRGASLVSSPGVLHEAMANLVSGLFITVYDECSTHVFFKIEPRLKRFYETPLDGWKEIIDAFPATIHDVEESGKCFALARHAAAVFHSLQVVEHGLIALGETMSISDPKSGFTATANELKRIMNKKYEDRTDWERRHFEFLEQMYGTVEGLKNAWRNKVSHAQNKLTLLTSNFSGEVAEEILYSSRAFMRRLATDLPKERRK